MNYYTTTNNPFNSNWVDISDNITVDTSTAYTIDEDSMRSFQDLWKTIFINEEGITVVNQKEEAEFDCDFSKLGGEA